MRKLLSLIACLVMGSAMLMAQTGVTGTVISSEDGEPIIGAAVLVTGTTTGTTMRRLPVSTPTTSSTTISRQDQT